MNSMVHRSGDSELSRERIDNQTAYDLAIAIARKAGFTLASVSRLTEACYFTHLGRPDMLMRLSMHSSNRSPIGMNAVVARASFAAKNNHLSIFSVHNTMRFVIGDYFMRDPTPSRYRGKRGTWENQGPTP